MNYTIRHAGTADEAGIYALYIQVAQSGGAIAREQDEITTSYIAENLKKALKNGVCMLISHPDNEDMLLAEIHCHKPEPRVFSHILSDLTIIVHPDYQGQGLGRILFSTFLKHIKEERPDVLRVELIARESNKKAIAFYSKIGFAAEGRFEKRIRNTAGGFEADIPMAWLNTNFGYR